MTSEFNPGDTIAVRHDLWQADLVVEPVPGRLRHGLHGTTASYAVIGDLLRVDWDAYGPEVYVREGAVYAVADLRPRVSGGSATPIDPYARQKAAVAGSVLDIDALSLRLPDGSGSVLVRPATSDVAVFESVFFAGAYDVPMLDASCDVVVDLGANTGLSSLYMALRCPQATVVAVEPARGNYALLAANARDRTSVIPVEAAIWPRDGAIELQDSEPSGAAMQPWAYRTVEAGSGLGRYPVEALSVPTLMRRYGLGAIDVLKVHVGGAEHDLFAGEVESWLPRVGTVLIETHERFRPGTDALISRVLAPAFRELEPRGENRVFTRRG